MKKILFFIGFLVIVGTIQAQKLYSDVSEDFEISSVTVLYKNDSYGITRINGNEVTCILTPDAYGKELEFRVWSSKGIGSEGDVLRFDPSVLINQVEFIGNAAPYYGVVFRVGIPPKVSGAINFYAGLDVFRGSEIIAKIDINFKIDTISVFSELETLGSK